MIRQAIELVADLAAKAARAARSATLEHAGRSFVYSDARSTYEEVQAHKVDARELPHNPVVLNVDSLLAWANDAQRHGLDGTLTLSRTDASKATAPNWCDQWDRRKTVAMPFFADFLPPAGPVHPIQFRAWLDSVGDGLVDREAVLAEVGSLVAASGTTSKVRMTGAIVQAMGETKQDVQGGMRRVLKAQIPFGDPAHVAPVSFLVTASASRDGLLMLEANRLRLDNANDAWLAWAIERATAALPEGWTLLVVP